MQAKHPMQYTGSVMCMLMKGINIILLEARILYSFFCLIKIPGVFGGEVIKHIHIVLDCVLVWIYSSIPEGHAYRKPSMALYRSFLVRNFLHVQVTSFPPTIAPLCKNTKILSWLDGTSKCSTWKQGRQYKSFRNTIFLYILADHGYTSDYSVYVTGQN